ncbi:hypothetical protein B0H19DRAFT_1375896 [Mycena capillaripes]|nr:hypothetical protein B0H19DRAFT_1375896 [Mycena capillaripes]
MSQMTVLCGSPGKADRERNFNGVITKERPYEAAQNDGDLSWEVMALEAEGPNIVAQRPRQLRLGEMMRDNLDDDKYQTLLDLIMDTRKEWESERESERIDRDAAIKDAVGKERIDRNAAIQDAVGKERDARLAAAKTAREARDETDQQLRRQVNALTERAIQKAEAVEKHESLDLTLQAFDDRIFDTRPRVDGKPFMKNNEKEYLKSVGMNYILKLLDPPSSILKRANANNSRKKLDSAITKALSLLTKQEQELCRKLYDKRQGKDKHNKQQHCKPDVATAIARIETMLPEQPHLYPVLTAFLNSDPQRIRSEGEGVDVDLSLFASRGTYKSVAEQRVELAKLKETYMPFQMHF